MSLSVVVQQTASLSILSCVRRASWIYAVALSLQRPIARLRPINR